MLKKMLVVGLVIGILAVGALALWALPGRVEAMGWGGSGSTDCDAGVYAGTAAATGAGYRGGRGTVDGGMSGWQNEGRGQGGAGLAGTGAARSDGTVRSGSLTGAEVSALIAALEDEHKAKALYEQAIVDLGSVRPLTQIVRAEERHIAALENLFTRYGLEVPAVEADAQDVAFDTLADACAAGVTAEKANAALYDELFAQADNADLTRVFTALQSASLNQHLPALEACAP